MDGLSFNERKRSAIFDALIGRCPNSAPLLEAIKQLECFCKDEEALDVIALEIGDKAADVIEAFQAEYAPQDQASYEHERFEARM